MVKKPQRKRPVKTTPKFVRIRDVEIGDIPRINEIENQNPDPKTEKELFSLLRRSKRKSINIVAELNGIVVGFAICWIKENILHILAFAVHKNCRRIGIGTEMMAEIIKVAPTYNVISIIAGVRETKLVALLFLRSQKFLVNPEKEGVLHRHYKDTRSDAPENSYLDVYLMVRLLSEGGIYLD